MGGLFAGGLFAGGLFTGGLFAGGLFAGGLFASGPSPVPLANPQQHASSLPLAEFYRCH